MDLRQLGAMALLLLVAAIIISIGSSIFDGIAEQQCEDLGGTWALYSANASHGGTTCCTTAGLNSTECYGITESYSLNVTSESDDAMETLGEWLPLIALVIAAAIVIGVIVGYLGRS